MQDKGHEQRSEARVHHLLSAQMTMACVPAALSCRSCMSMQYAATAFGAGIYAVSMLAASHLLRPVRGREHRSQSGVLLEVFDQARGRGLRARLQRQVPRHAEQGWSKRRFGCGGHTTAARRRLLQLAISAKQIISCSAGKAMTATLSALHLTSSKAILHE